MLYAIHEYYIQIIFFIVLLFPCWYTGTNQDIKMYTDLIITVLNACYWHQPLTDSLYKLLSLRQNDSAEICFLFLLRE